MLLKQDLKKSQGTKKPITKKPLKERLQIYNYDTKINNLWKMINNEIPEYSEIYKKYENLLINQSFSKPARVNNIRTLLSLGRIAKSNNISSWDTITKDQVNEIVSFVMKTWADPDGQETWHTADHKKFLMLFVRWVKTGRRKYSRKYPEPDEIRDIAIKKVPKN